jgi:ABC-type glycerol-3-phosphate transport system substrate-binding protein
LLCLAATEEASVKARAGIPVALILVLLLAGCGGSSAPQADGEPLTVWSLEHVSSRVRATQALVDRFQRQTGIQTRLIAVTEDQFPTLIAAANRPGGQLPDAIGALSLGLVHRLAADGVADPEAADEIIEKLGRETFSPRALRLVESHGDPVAVPSDGWTQVLVYRKDLFDRVGLPRPDTYERVRAAAARLNTGGRAGIVAATRPGDTFTQQTFEHFALANGCRLTDAAGRVGLTSRQCVDAFRFYTDLIRAFSVRGPQGVDSTRRAYLDGKAAMVVWSTYILDELAGLRDDVRPGCPECKADPAYLARHSGVVAGLRGPDASGPSSYGEISGWAVTRHGRTDDARRFVEFMMGDAYTDWLALAPEGKFPVRTGTPDDPARFTRAWERLETGQVRRAPLGRIYPRAVLDVIRGTPDTISRWGFLEGQGALAGALLGGLPVPAAIAAVLDGRLNADQAARQSLLAVEELRRELDGQGRLPSP